MCCLLALPCTSQAVVIGSESTVSVISTSTVFPSADTDNTMLGFGWFQDGFTFEDLNTSCTFNSVFPVSGTIDMNGGTLYLERDMVLQNITELSGLGTIIGNNHIITLCESITSFPSDLTLIKDLTIKGANGVSLTSTMTVQGTCRIIGSNNFLDLNGGGIVIVDHDSSLELQNTLIKGVKNNNIGCVDETSLIILNNAEIELTGDVHFENGAINILNTSRIFGGYTFWYDSAAPCYIARESNLLVCKNVTFKIGKKTPEGLSQLSFYDESSIISCSDCILKATENGIELTKGRIQLYNNTIITADSTDTAHGIILGDGESEENDIKLELKGGCQSTFASGALVYNNIKGSQFTSDSSNSYFIRKINSVFHMATTCTYPTSTLEFEFDGIHFPETTLAPDAKLYYNNTRVIIPGYGDGTFNARREGTFPFILDTDDSIYIANGYFVGGVNIIGAGNIIAGSGSIAGPLVFNDGSSRLALNLVGSVLYPIMLNGGKLTLQNNINVNLSNCFSSSGTIDLNNYTLTYQLASSTPSNTFDVALTWSGNNGSILFSHDMSLTSTWTIQGICTINGNGNTFSLDTNGKLLVDSNSELTLRNMRIHMIGLDDLACIDDTGKIILDNVYWIQDEDYTFDKGSLEIKNDVTVNGPFHTFTYASTQTSFIHYNSALAFDSDITFSYAPTNGDQTLLDFDDYSSVLYLKGSTLCVNPGLQLTKGKLQISKSPTIYAYDEGLERGAGGLTLGNSVIDDDMTLKYVDGSTLNIASGSLNYKNVAQDAIEAWGGGKMHILSNTSLNIFENMYCSVILFDNSTYAYKTGKQINGSIASFGTPNIIEFQ